MLVGCMKWSEVSLNIIYQKANFVKHRTSPQSQSLFCQLFVPSPITVQCIIWLKKYLDVNQICTSNYLQLSVYIFTVLCAKSQCFCFLMFCDYCWKYENRKCFSLTYWGDDFQRPQCLYLLSRKCIIL